MRKIQFIDLYSQYLSIKSEIDNAIEEVIKNSEFIRGRNVEEFEKQFALSTNRKYCISCANGTDSLYLSMKMLNIKPGDEVIVPAHSWISTSETVTQAGGKVIFCDTTSDTFLIDCEQIEKKITDRTVGIIPVHLFGQSVDMDKIKEIASKYGLWVIEDCAQSHFAKYKNKYVGTFGDVASYSFYPGKNLGAMGDAGAITTDNTELANKIAMYARHGGLMKGDHQIEGVNSRMDGLQAAILNVKLKYIKSWTETRRSKANIYLDQLSDVEEIKLPITPEYNEHVWHLFVIKVNDRDNLRDYLLDNQIPTIINYPTALPFLPAYKYLGIDAEEFPNSYKNQTQILSLPLYPEFPYENQMYVIEKIKKYYSGKYI